MARQTQKYFTALVTRDRTESMLIPIGVTADPDMDQDDILSDARDIALEAAENLYQAAWELNDDSSAKPYFGDEENDLTPISAREFKSRTEALSKVIGEDLSFPNTAIALTASSIAESIDLDVIERRLQLHGHPDKSLNRHDLTDKLAQAIARTLSELGYQGRPRKLAGAKRRKA